MLAIVDYGMGNLRSVEKAFAHIGARAKVVNSRRAINDASAIVLPGVGAFRDCIKNLESLELRYAIVDSIKSGKPFLGICLGLQVLFTESEEFGKCNGFDIFPGKVVRFPDTPGLKVPHMGWNRIKILKPAPVLEGIPDGSFFYFVHSYYVSPEDADVRAATTDYGMEFTSMIWKDNVFAVQFHPEKSQEAGLRMLKNFSEFVKKQNPKAA
jgi:glutamine amidotransferase